MIQAGKLRQRVTLQRLTDTTNDYNEVVSDWSTLGSVRASIEPLTGREYMAGSGEESEVTARVRMRATPVTCGLTPNDRLISGCDIVYDIVSVIDPWEYGREVQLMCRRAGKQGPDDG